MSVNGIDVGSRLRSFRKRYGLTLNQLSGKTGIAVSNLSSMERGKSSPTLQTLMRIAAAFHMKPGAFLDSVLENGIVVCRQSEAQELTASRPGHVVRVLTGNLPDCPTECRVVILGADSDFYPLPPDKCTRFVYCLSGRLSVQWKGETERLLAGDGLHMLPDSDATLKNSGSSEASVLVIRDLHSAAPFDRNWERY